MFGDLLLQKRVKKSTESTPTQKPIELLNRIILASTKENDFVLDPFSGSGTTGVACKLNGRNYIGIELEKNFAELSKKG